MGHSMLVGLSDDHAKSRMRGHMVFVKNRDVGRDLHPGPHRVRLRKMGGYERKESRKGGLAIASWRKVDTGIQCEVTIHWAQT